MKTERRQYPRAKVKWPVMVETAERFIYGEAVDISANGAFICCQKPLELNEKFCIATIEVPPSNRHLPARAKVIRADICGVDDDPLSHGIAVRFTDISVEDREEIFALVKDRVPPEGIH